MPPEGSFRSLWGLACGVLALANASCGLAYKTTEERNGLTSSKARPEFEPQTWLVVDAATNEATKYPKFKINWAGLRTAQDADGNSEAVSFAAGDVLMLKVQPASTATDACSGVTSWSSWGDATLTATTVSGNYYEHALAAQRAISAATLASGLAAGTSYLLSAAVLRDGDKLLCIPKVAQIEYDTKAPQLSDAALPDKGAPAQSAALAVGLRYRDEFLEVSGSCTFKRGSTTVPASAGDRMYVTLMGIEVGEDVPLHALVQDASTGGYTTTVYVDSTQFPDELPVTAEFKLVCESANGNRTETVLATGVDYLEPVAANVALIPDYSNSCSAIVQIACNGDETLESADPYDSGGYLVMVPLQQNCQSGSFSFEAFINQVMNPGESAQYESFLFKLTDRGANSGALSGTVKLSIPADSNIACPP